MIWIMTVQFFSGFFFLVPFPLIARQAGGWLSRRYYWLWRFVHGWWAIGSVTTVLRWVTWWPGDTRTTKRWDIAYLIFCLSKDRFEVNTKAIRGGNSKCPIGAMEKKKNYLYEQICFGFCLKNRNLLTSTLYLLMAERGLLTCNPDISDAHFH